MKNQRLDKIPISCNSAWWTKKDILNKSWDKMVIDVSAIWDRKELHEGKFNSMCMKFLHFWSDILFWSLYNKYLTPPKSTVNLEM